MAKLNFKYATMNSGKSLDLIRTVHNYEENDYKVLVLKPKSDTKGNDKVVSRVGLERQVDFLIDTKDSIIELLQQYLTDVACIFIDEAQFLTSKQVDDLLIIAKYLDIDVICYGLRTNFRMESFEGSKRLFEIADELEELKTMCRCGNIARFNGRKENGIFVDNGEEIVIDGTTNIKYVPLCGKCYLQKVKKIEHR